VSEDTRSRNMTKWRRPWTTCSRRIDVFTRCLEDGGISVTCAELLLAENAAFAFSSDGRPVCGHDGPPPKIRVTSLSQGIAGKKRKPLKQHGNRLQQSDMEIA
jgi:hypothetical protein